MTRHANGRSTAGKPSTARSNSPWTTLSTAVRYEDPWIQLLENQVIDPAGRRTIYRTVHHRQRAVTVLPINEHGQTTLVGQFRYTLGRYSWELPGGGGSWEEPPETSALRELREETGLIAKHLIPVLQLDISNGIGDEQAFCFLAYDLKPGRMQPDENEVLSLRRLPFGDAVNMAQRGELTEAVSVALVLRVDQMVRTGEAPDVILGLLDARAGRSGKRARPTVRKKPAAPRTGTGSSGKPR